MATCMGILRNVKFQLTLYIIGTIVGLFAFFAFWLMMHYMYAAILGAVSAVYAASLSFEIYFQHNIKEGREIIPHTETRVPLIFKFVFAAVGMSVGLGFMFFLITSGILASARFDDGLYMGAIQAWMTFKWSLSWTIHLYHYHHLTSNRNNKLLEGQAPWETQE